MNSDTISPLNIKEKPSKVCPYLGLIEDSQTALSFSSGSNVCYHAKPLASPNLEYQRSVCLKGRRHTLCPVFTRTELAPLPLEISGGLANKLGLGRPISKRVLLLILLGCVVLFLVGLGVFWLLNNRNAISGLLSGKPGSPTPTISVLPFATATLSTTNIPITPNVGISLTETLVASPSQTQTPQPSLTFTLIGTTTVPIQTQIPCGSPNNWVVYIVRAGDTLSRLSQVYGVSIAELQRANCLGTSTVLHTGQILYVPFVATFAPSATLPFVIPTITLTDTPVPIPPSDTPTEPPVDTATQFPNATEIPTATQVPIATEVPTATQVPITP